MKQTYIHHDSRPPLKPPPLLELAWAYKISRDLHCDANAAGHLNSPQKHVGNHVATTETTTPLWTRREMDECEKHTTTRLR